MVLRRDERPLQGPQYDGRTAAVKEDLVHACTRTARWQVALYVGVDSSQRMGCGRGSESGGSGCLYGASSAVRTLFRIAPIENGFWIKDTPGSSTPW